MPAYTRSEAKDWARENFRGAGSVITPSYTSDLRSLNENAIRHDVRRNIELGFWRALLVSEAGITLAEMSRFMEIAVGEAAGRHHFLLQGVLDTAQDIVDMANDAAAIGVDAMLLGHPNSFYPTTAEDGESYRRSVCPGHHHGNRGSQSGPPLSMEVPGVAERLQPRAAAPTGHEAVGKPDAHLGRRPPQAGVSAAHEPFADFFIGRNPD